MNHVPYDLYALDWHSLAYHALHRFKRVVCSDGTMPPDVADHIEESVIPALEWLEGWEPSDAQIQAHIESRGMF